MDIGTLTGHLELEGDFTSSVNAGNKALQGLDKTFRDLGSTLTRGGAALTAAITVPLTGAAVASASFSSSFEAQMTRLVSIAGVLPKELDAVKQHILDMAPDVGIGPGALAEAMTKVSSTVDDTATALKILDIAAQGTKAGFGETVDVAGALTSVINSYGKDNISAAHAADVLAQAIKDGGAEARELAPTLANVVPFAAQLGVKFEEVAANIATMTKLGVPTAEAVTSLTSVFSALTKETNQGQEALAQMGLKYSDLRAQIKDKGLAATLTDLAARFKGNETAMVDVFGRIEAVKNIMATAGSQGETYAKVLSNIQHSSDSANGAMKDMADAMNKTQIQSWKQLSASVEVAAIKFGDALAPTLMKVLDNMKPLMDYVIKAVEWFGKLPSGVQTAAIAFGAAAAAIGPLLVGAGLLVQALGALAPLLPALGTALAVLTGPFGVAAIAIAGVATSVFMFRNRLEELENFKSKSGKPLEGLKNEAGQLLLTLDEANKKLKETIPAVNGAEVGLSALGIKIQVVSTETDKATVSAGKHVVKTKEQIENEKRHAEALVLVNDKIAIASRSTAALTAAQESQMMTLKALGLTTEEIATKMGIGENAVKKMEQAWKNYDSMVDLTLELETKFGKESEDIHNRWQAAVSHSADEVAKAMLSTFEIQRNAEKRLAEDLASQNTFDKQRRALIQWSQDQKRQLEANGQDWSRAWEAVTDVVTHELEAIDIAEEEALGDVGIDLENVAKKGVKLTDTLHSVATSLTTLSQSSHGALSSVAKDITNVIVSWDTATEGFKNFQDAQTKTGKGLAIAQGVAGVAQSTGSGSAFSRIAGGALSGASTGAMIGSVVPVIGTAIGAGVGAIIGAGIGIARSFGASEAEKAGREIEASFEKAMGGFDSMVANIAKAYEANGLGAQAARSDIEAMINAEKMGPEAVQMWIDKIQEQLDKQVLVKNSVDGIVGAVQNFGHALPDSIKSSISALLEMKGLTDDEKDSLQALLDGGKTNFEALASRASQFGITLEQLGPKFEQANVEQRAKDIYNIFTDLTAVGGDADGVLAGLRDEIQGLVSDSLKFGSAIPDNIKPLIKQLILTGQLTDESGEKLTDVGDLTFEDTPLDTSLQTLSKAIDHLAEILGGVPKQLTDVANAASQIPDNPFANWQPPRFDEANYMAQGGRVTANGVHYLAEGNIFTPRGSDVVPAMLTPGEEVSSASDVQSRNASMTALARQQAMTNEKLGNIEQLLRDNSSDLPRQLRDALLLAS